ncbi:MAG: DUF5615 family PIN-like protein [Verrucomicrobia bacterium]|nr:DUF5615 family PIN-like protein [Verrucomicrobiota bacterium]
MKFLLDHDVPAEVGQLLRYWGHDAQQSHEVLSVDAPDAEVFAQAQKDGRVIVSCNRDHFLTLANRSVALKEEFPGLVILIRRRTRQAECGRLLTLLRRAGENGLDGNINFA